MSSADGANTSKTSRPPGEEELPRRGERLQPLLVRREVEVRPERARDERHPLLDRRAAQVADPEVEPLSHARGARLLCTDLEHPRGGVDADHVHAGRRRRDRDAPRPDAELDDRAARGERLLDVEGDVLDDARAPRVVEPCNPVVCAHGI
jgi:hypothetical protein